MTCPVCDRPTEAAWRPFCSKRCADVDLGRWLTGGYAVPSTDPDESDAAAGAAEDASDDAGPGGRPH